MPTYTYDHLHYRSTDPEAAAAVWKSAFGATEKSRMQVGPNLRIVLDVCGVTLFLEQVPQGTAAPPPPPFLGVEHLGLGVDDLDAAIADLAARGVACLSGPTSPRPGVRIAFFAMPDGARVELIERKG